MSREQYVACLTDLLSGVPERVRDANDKLYRAAIEGNREASELPVLALAEAEQRLTG